MVKNHIYKLQLYSGLIGVIVLWTCIAIGMHKAHLGLLDKRPISYLGISPKSRALFSSSLLISAFLFINFGFYIKRKFKVKNKFMVYLIIGQIGQAMAAIFPYGLHTFAGHVHTIAAFVLAFSLPLLISEFSTSQRNSEQSKLYTKLLRFEQFSFVVGIGLFVFTKGLAPLGEALPTVGFHLWIVVLTYLSLKSGQSSRRGLFLHDFV